MSSDDVVWDECSLNNNCVSGFILLSGLETLGHASKIKLMLSPENFGEK